MDLAFGLLRELLSRMTFGDLCSLIGLVVACYTLYVNIQLRDTVQRLEADRMATRQVERRTDVRIAVETLTTLREIAESLRAMQTTPRARQDGGREPPRAREVEAGAHEDTRASAEGTIVRTESTRAEKVTKALQDLTQKQWGEFEPEEVDW
ncbi:hypothetical protein PENSPDRAFT_659898 [Peniophora sp. CONT]|nr:hypothetical protein PENSPDRAFT_659898 [Peniophora sp. CONT]